MCRYHNIRRNTQLTYKCKFVCVDCRQVKKAFHEDLQSCVMCGKVMSDIGLDYRPPRKTNNRGWVKLGVLIEQGVGFHSCGCQGPSLEPPRKITDGGFYKMYNKLGKWVNR